MPLDPSRKNFEEKTVQGWYDTKPRRLGLASMMLTHDFPLLAVHWMEYRRPDELCHHLAGRK